MNATSLYISTCRLIVQAIKQDPSNWRDLQRLVPYLRQSLSCCVCTNLLLEPHTPVSTGCHHHVCRVCQTGRKKLKPLCMCCKFYVVYTENVQLRMILQCYKKLCSYFRSTEIFKEISAQAELTENAGLVSLVELICEGAGLNDEYNNSGISKSMYNMLPCVYTNTTTQTRRVQSETIKTEQDFYSVLVAESGNKLTIKRKTNEEASEQSGNSFKKPPVQQTRTGGKVKSVSVNKRKGCRCGNATPTPGKLTCCGQRCPCYVEGKACIECKCRGCRNPHRPDGVKVRPQIPKYENVQIHYPEVTDAYVPSQNQVSDSNSTMFTSQNIRVINLNELTHTSNVLPSALLTENDFKVQQGSDSDVDIDI